MAGLPNPASCLSLGAAVVSIDDKINSYFTQVGDLASLATPAARILEESVGWLMPQTGDVLLLATAFFLLAGVRTFLNRAKRRQVGDVHPAKRSRAPLSPPSQDDVPIVPGGELSHALRVSRKALVSVGIFSAFSNLLMLTGAMFMLLVYDRVLTSGSVPTLVGLAVLVGMLFSIQAVLDFARSRILLRVGGAIDEAMSPRLFHLVTRMPLLTGTREAGLRSIRDLDAIRSFLSGPGIIALFDMPWLPFYLGVIYLFHPLLGIVATIGAVIILLMACLAEILSRKPSKQATAEAQRRASIADASQRNAEVVAAMGMSAALSSRFVAASRDHAVERMHASDASGGVGSISKSFRLMLQSAMIGVGAYLAIIGEASAGIIIAGSIISGRALAPVDQAISQWKGFVYARQGWRRLTDALAALPADTKRLTLPAPRNRLELEGVTVLAPGGQRVLVRDIVFAMSSGSALGIIGSSGSGKSSLVRALVGAWRPAAGRIKLDGADLDQWPEGALGRHIGYLPQDVELFEGTIAENIGRFDPNATAEKIIEAASAAGVHEMVLNFRDGYQTQIGEDGAKLSAGQRQRIALARALYGNPFLVVLDEPNANLDTDGDQSLMAAIGHVRERGGVVIIVSHRPSALAAVNLVMIMQNSRSVAFGERDEVLGNFYPTLNVGAPPAPRIRRPERSKFRIVAADKTGALTIAEDTADADAPEAETT